MGEFYIFTMIGIAFAMIGIAIIIFCSAIILPLIVSGRKFIIKHDLMLSEDMTWLKQLDEGIDDGMIGDVVTSYLVYVMIWLILSICIGLIWPICVCVILIYVLFKRNFSKKYKKSSNL